ERWLADDRVGAYDEGLSERLARLARRHRTAVRVGAAALFAVAGLSVAALGMVSGARQRDRREFRVRTLPRALADARRPVGGADDHLDQLDRWADELSAFDAEAGAEARRMNAERFAAHLDDAIRVARDAGDLERLAGRVGRLRERDAERARELTDLLARRR